jgi:homoprotocatechuate degradation regulator HpaR
MTQPTRPTQRSLPIALLRARETVMEPVREMLQRSGISEQKWRVLRVVEESGPLEQTAIAQSASLLMPSLTRLNQAMIEDGLLTRATDPKDKRKAIISITDKGRALILEHLGERRSLTGSPHKSGPTDRICCSIFWKSCVNSNCKFRVQVLNKKCSTSPSLTI